MCLTAAMVLRESLVVSGVQAPPQSSSPPGSEGNGWRTAERLTIKTCADCHVLAVITAERRTASAWLEIVDAMVAKGAEGTATELATIAQFLTRTRGIVAVNTAPAADFVSVLGLSSEADSVVAYRAAHGRFANVDALLGVPGLNRKSLEREDNTAGFD